MLQRLADRREYLGVSGLEDLRLELVEAHPSPHATHVVYRVKR